MQAPYKKGPKSARPARVAYPFAAIPNHVIRGGHGAVNLAVLAVLLSHGTSTAALQTLADELGVKRETVKKGIEYWKAEGAAFGINLNIEARNRQPYVIEIDVDRCESQTVGMVLTDRNRKRVKIALFEEQGNRCYYCGGECWMEPDGKMREGQEIWKYNGKCFVLEHKIPLARGGLDTTANVVGACDACNTKKRTMTDTEFSEAYPQKGISSEEPSTPQKGGSLTPNGGVALPPKRGTDEEHMKKNPEEDTPLPPKGEDETVINKQVAEIIDVFKKTVSPTLTFGHVGQRSAARRVIEAVGFDRALSAARFACAVLGKDFAPTITKPSELENKYGALQAFYAREATRAPQSITI